MDVQNTLVEIVRDAQQLEETGQTHEIDAGIPAVSEDAVAELFARGARFSLDAECGEIGLPRARQSERIGLAGDDDGDFRAQQAIGDAVEEVLQRGAAAAEQYGQPDGIVHGASLDRMCRRYRMLFSRDSITSTPSGANRYIEEAQAMLFNWWQRKQSARQDRRPSREPRTRPPLQPCPAPAEPGPEQGTDIPDLRAVLLELVADHARLRRNHSLFQKETQRFESVLEPLPGWLVQMYNLTPSRRRDIALYWAKRLQLTRRLSIGRALWLEATQTGRNWLTQPIEEQYAHIYQRLRDRDHSDDPDEYWGHEFDDGWFLGVAVSAVPLRTSWYSRNDGGGRLTLEDRQPLREALYAAFAELPLGVFHRFDNFAGHVCFGPHNPLLLGRRSDQVRIRVAGGTLLPRGEPLYETGRHVLGQLVSNRLVSLGCLQAGRDADGELLIARLPRLDVYFGRPAPAQPRENSVPSVVVVQPDFSVLVIGPDQTPLAELLPFCERIRERSSPGAAMLHLTRDSVVKGAITGLSSAAMLERLQRHGSKSLPENVAHEVREWAGWVRAVSAEPLLLFRCPDAATAERILAALGRSAEKLNETTVAFASAALGDAERRKLLEHGIVLDRGETAL